MYHDGGNGEEMVRKWWGNPHENAIKTEDLWAENLADFGGSSNMEDRI